MNRKIIFFATLFLAATAYADPHPACRVLNGDRYTTQIGTADTSFRSLHSLLEEVAPDTKLPGSANELMAAKDGTLIRALADETFGPTVHQLTGAPAGDNVRDAMYRLRRAAVSLRAQLESPKYRSALPATIVMEKGPIIGRINDFLNATHPLLQHFDCVYTTQVAARDARRLAAAGETGGYCVGPQILAPESDQVCDATTAQVANGVESTHEAAVVAESADICGGTQTCNASAGSGQ
jgi:hypothetical protein